MSKNSIADARAEALGLTRHPEGGWYKETYRAEHSVGEGRAASTAIYFMLAAGETSALHRIDADEVWHHYEGESLRIHVFDEQGYHSLLLGSLDTPGAAPQHVVRAGAWFGAEVVGEHGHVLVGCTVAPGFEFEHFELAVQAEMLERWPQHSGVIRRLT